MSAHIEPIAAQMNAIGTGLAKAQHLCAAADQHTERAAARAAQAGLTGIAGNTARITTAIADLSAEVAAAGSAVAEARTLVHAVGDQPSPGQAANILTTTLETVNGAHARTGTAIARAVTAGQVTSAVLRGGQPGQLLAHLDTIRHILQTVAQAASALRLQIETALKEAHQVGAATTPGSDGATAEQQPADPDHHRVPGTTLDDLLADPDPPAWLNDAATSLPQRPNDIGPTTGRLFDSTGQPIGGTPLAQTGGELRSGRVDAARDGLRSDWYPHAQVIREHVEMHAAALLRRPGTPDDAVVVINKPTCRTRGRYIGCDEVLPGALPAGKRLAVYVTDGQHTTLLKVHHGTGEGIQR